MSRSAIVCIGVPVERGGCRLASVLAFGLWFRWHWHFHDDRVYTCNCLQISLSHVIGLEVVYLENEVGIMCTSKTSYFIEYR